MHNDLKRLLAHEYSDDCMVCRAQDVVAFSLVPAAAAWETANELPQYSVALNGAAQLLAAMIADGLSRNDVEEALNAFWMTRKHRLKRRVFSEAPHRVMPDCRTLQKRT